MFARLQSDKLFVILSYRPTELSLRVSVCAL